MHTPHRHVCEAGDICICYSNPTPTNNIRGNVILNHLTKVSDVAPDLRKARLYTTSPAEFWFSRMSKICEHTAIVDRYVATVGRQLYSRSNATLIGSVNALDTAPEKFPLAKHTRTHTHTQAPPDLQDVDGLVEVGCGGFVGVGLRLLVH